MTQITRIMDQRMRQPVLEIVLHPERWETRCHWSKSTNITSNAREMQKKCDKNACATHQNPPNFRQISKWWCSASLYPFQILHFVSTFETICVQYERKSQITTIWYFTAVGCCSYFWIWKNIINRTIEVISNNLNA